MASIILFIFYFALLTFCLNRLKFATGAGLSRLELNLLFALKVVAALALGWFSETLNPQGSDYFTLNNYGKEEYALLKSDPGTFFTSIFTSYYNHYDGFFASTGSFWNDLKNNLIIKSLALMHVFTGSNYYVNSLFFAFGAFIGHLALFRMFLPYFPNRKLLVLAGAFLIPSTLYFSSGIHKDAVVFTALAFFCYALIRQFEQPTRRRYWLIALCALILLLVRSHVLISLLVATTAFLLYKKSGRLRSYVFVYSSALVFILVTSYIPSANPIRILAQKQTDFFALPQARSHIQTDTLTPTATGLLRNTPQAIKNGFTEPHPWKNYNVPLRILGFETWLYLALFIYVLFRHNKTPHAGMLLFCMSIAIPLFLFAGYIVPNAGAIVRYRALYYPWVILPLFMVIRWPKKTY